MSWSHYATYKSVVIARKHIEELKEPTPEAQYGTPKSVKTMILSAIDACGITDEENTALKIEASGHSPGGTTLVKVEPIFLFG